MSANADTAMYESLRIASHCVFPQSYPLFAYRLLADAAEPFVLIRVSVSRARTIRFASSPLVLALRLGFYSKRTCLLTQTPPCMKAYGLLHTACSRNPTRYSHIGSLLMRQSLLCSYGLASLERIRSGLQAARSSPL